MELSFLISAPSARTASGSRTSSLFSHPYQVTLRGRGEAAGPPRRAAETAGPPPLGWAISNQLGGQGALWTERDKRPCVHRRLLIYRPFHPPTLPSGRPGPLCWEGAAPRSYATARPLAAGPRSPRAGVAPLPAQGRDSPGFSAVSLPAPAGHDPRAQRGPETGPWSSSAPA